MKDTGGRFFLCELPDDMPEANQEHGLPDKGI